MVRTTPEGPELDHGGYWARFGTRVSAVGNPLCSGIAASWPPVNTAADRAFFEPPGGRIRGLARAAALRPRAGQRPQDASLRSLVTTTIGFDIRLAMPQELTLPFGVDRHRPPPRRRSRSGSHSAQADQHLLGVSRSSHTSCAGDLCAGRSGPTPGSAVHQNVQLLADARHLPMLDTPSATSGPSSHRAPVRGVITTWSSLDLHRITDSRPLARNLPAASVVPAVSSSSCKHQRLGG